MNRLIRLIAAAAIAITLGACASPPGAGTKTPAPDVVVFTAKAAYETALTGMTAYARLPRCAPATQPVCSTQAILDQLERGRAAARVAIDAAEGAVRTPGFGQDATQSAIVAADAAAKALTGILATLPKRTP